ncbi:FeoA family protein [Desulfotomaculum varum]
MLKQQPVFSGAPVIALCDLPVGKAAIVNTVQGEGIIRRRMLDLGLVPGTRVEALRISPAGDPKAYKIRGAVIALRQEEGAKILVSLKEEKKWG